MIRCRVACCAKRLLPFIVAILLGLGLLALLPSEWSGGGGKSKDRDYDITRVVSPGGIEAWLIEDHGVPVISVEAAFRGGAALDPEGKAGLAHFVSGTLDEGAGDLDSQAFQKRLADLSIRLSFQAGRDSFTGSLRTLTDTREDAFRLLGLALTEPRFDTEPVERIRAQITAALQGKRQDPDYKAGRAFAEMLYGDHPYARPTDGLPDSIAAITGDDLADFAATRLTRDRLVVGVSGDITADALGPLLDRAFAGLPETSDLPAVPDLTVETTGETRVIDMAIPQSVALFGQRGLDRHDPDFYPAYVVNHVLGGGGFASRLVEQVREERGLAYSVYSYLAPHDHAAIWAGGVSTNNADVARSLDLVRAEWARMAADGPTAEELADAKTYLTGSYPLRFSSTAATAGILASVQLEDLGIDFLNRRNGLVEAVTPSDARRVAAERMKPDALSAVVVGQPDGLK